MGFMNVARAGSRNRALALGFLVALAGGCDSHPRDGSTRAPVFVVINAERRAGEYPQTFEIPALERRRSCKAGDLAKVILEAPPGAPRRRPGGERPWLLIREVRPGPRYLGNLDNDLVVFPELKKDEPIEFGPEHIIQLWEDPKGK